MRETVYVDRKSGANGSNKIVCEDQELMDRIIQALENDGLRFDKNTGTWIWDD